MERRTLPSRMNAIVRRLLPAVVLIVGLGGAGEVAASAVEPAVFDADDHAQYCKCRNCRKESCCCGPRRTKAVEPRAIPGAEPVRVDARPCMGAAPCGDAGLPDAPVPGPSGKVASLACGRDAVAVTAGRLVPPDGRCILPSRRASRLDEPPEHLDLA